jgi:ABC-type transporter Mla maintaining outer membrane lipid asymmetry permease subunit MlaE
VVLPRLLGVAISALMLVAYFQCIAIAAALGATAVTLGTTLESELEHFLAAATWWQVPLSLGKAVLMGAGIAVIACHHGLQAEHDVRDIRKAVVSAGIGSLSFVLAVDLFAVLLLLA